MMRAVGGARGRFEEWTWETSLHKTQDDVVTMRANDLDQTRVASALSATNPAEALNPFGGSGANSPELLASLLAAPTRDRFRTEMTQATAHIRGPLLTLPAGRADLIIGAERRKEQVRYDITLGPPLSGSHQRFVTAAFGEVRLPVVSAAARIPAADEISIVLSARFDDYSDVGDSFNPEYAVLWRPVPALTVRTSQSQSFRPPPLFDLYMPLVDVPFPIVDPARNNELAFPIVRAGGNADLKPADADTFTTGVRFAPTGAYGLRLAASYWRIRADQTIGIPDAERLLAAESRFRARVIRDEPSAADLAAGIPGPLELIDIRRVNYGSVRTSGIDFSASMAVDTRVGHFVPELSATWVDDFTTSDLVEGSDVDRVGVANSRGSVTRWRAVGGLAWSHHGIGLSAKARYVPSYDDVDILGKRTGRSVDAQTLIDTQLTVDLSEVAGAESICRGFEIRAGVFNVLDEQPPFAEVGFNAGYDGSQGDLRQRFWYVKLSKDF
jgi:iron complex outermembrane receptor protein